MNDECFQLKGSAVTAIVLEIYRFDSEQFSAQLENRIAQAPGLFQQSPVVISLEKIQQPASAAELQALVQRCRQAGLQPMAFRAANELAPLVSTTELPLLPVGTGRSLEAAVSSAETASPTATTTSDTEAPKQAMAPRSKIVSRPVRSGQQVYAEGDLIILAQVSEGAEVLASGNIHVYGPLRGRALAGVKGDSGARIFCQSLEAELVSIAGNFKLSDSLREERWRQSAQIILEDESLNIMPL